MNRIYSNRRCSALVDSPKLGHIMYHGIEAIRARPGQLELCSEERIDQSSREIGGGQKERWCGREHRTNLVGVVGFSAGRRHFLRRRFTEADWDEGRRGAVSDRSYPVGNPICRGPLRRTLTRSSHQGMAPGRKVTSPSGRRDRQNRVPRRKPRRHWRSTRLVRRGERFSSV